MLAALKAFKIRRYFGGLSPGNHKIFLENPQIVPMNTSSKYIVLFWEEKIHIAKIKIPPEKGRDMAVKSNFTLR